MSLNIAGWIRVNRNLRTSFSKDIQLNTELWNVYVFLAEQAAWTSFDGLEKGQLRFKSPDIKKHLFPDMSIDRCKKLMRILVRDKYINMTPISSNSKDGFIVEICHYDSFCPENVKNRCTPGVPQVYPSDIDNEAISLPNNHVNSTTCTPGVPQVYPSDCSYYIEKTNKQIKEELNTLPDTDEQCRDPFDEIIIDDHVEKAKKPKKEKPIGKSVAVINAYREAFYERYQSDPIIDASVRRQACTLVDRVGQDLAENVVRFYLTHNDRWYLKKAHEFKFCLADCKKLCLEMEKNCYITDDSVNNFLNREKSRANSRFRI